MRLLSAVCLLACLSLAYGDNYLIGRGRADVTGPVVEVEMMGYAMPQQYAHGLHFRQYSRAFIIADAQNSSRVVFVNADICMGSQAVKIEVVERLQKIYGKLYTNDNVLISGIHTHSGPAGYFQFVLFEVMSLGHIRQTLDAIVDGIVLSIQRAHENMVMGSLLYNLGNLTDASINRSPAAYEKNPPDEIKKYAPHNVDTLMTVLKMVDTNGNDIGMIDWFAVHCTSMNNTNRLISGDNKGHASYLMEHDMDPSALPGQSKFVAAFAQSNEGDVSPNTKGPHCLDTNLPCEFYHSTCNNKTENCVAQGPGKDMFDSTKIIGEKQFTLGKSLYQSAKAQITGQTVDYRHTFINFTNIPVTYNGTQNTTCPPAMGYSFAAGTIDGPGAFDFTQGDTKTNPFWNFVRNRLHKPSDKQIECHAPKPILLDTANIDISILKYPWQPSILPLQLLRVGQLVIIGVPAEFTTMSGRRLRDSVRAALVANGMPDPLVVIAGLSNTYSDYVATYEEYQFQRYEGASTVYGPYTLLAYQQEFSKLAAALAKGSTVDPGENPPNYLDKQVSFVPNVLYDGVALGKDFGQLRQDAEKSYKVGDVVEVRFWAGNPRNNLMQEKTFLTVEKKDSSGNFTVMYNDASWETKFQWHHTSVIIGELLGESEAVVTWDIPSDASLAGTYRIRHFGHHKQFGTGKISPYEGTSSEFEVTA